MRNATVSRNTTETQVSVSVALDGKGQYDVSTGVGFFDHMLQLFARHSKIDLIAKCTGDVYVDSHHTVEDTGIALGQAISRALGNKAGIRRYGTFTVPMDETLALVSMDISGRPFIVFDAPLSKGKLGDFEVETAEEFFRAVAVAAGITLHMKVLYGRNDHHMIEALFKAFARALREAVEPDPREEGIPSTKGVL